MYFSTLRAITVLCVICGLINLPTILYFASDEYNLKDTVNTTIPTLLQGSAICLDQSWVPCEECDCSDEDQWPDPDRCVTGISSTSNSTSLTFALKNNCDGATLQNGFVNYGTMIVVLLGTLLLAKYLKQQEVQFDEDEQTAQDYSIVITNPPHDAHDPQEWRTFFLEQLGATATVVTCAVDNDLLVQTLVERREILRTIENSVEPGTSLDILNLAKIAAEIEHSRVKFHQKLMAIIAPGLPGLFSRLVALNAKVQGLSQLDYPCTNVFVSFETEADQRKVLSKLSVGSLQAARNVKTAVSDPKYLFRGETVLAVAEPNEPSTVRWRDLNATFLDKLKIQLFTIGATLVAVALVALIVQIADNASTIGAALAISIANSIFPVFAKLLTNVERHQDEGLKQTSLYFKIALFRWVNTALVISIITPFTTTLEGEGGLIPQIYAIFIAEIVTANVIQLADPMGHVKRHLLAPRQRTQDAMNLQFQGTGEYLVTADMELNLCGIVNVVVLC